LWPTASSHTESTFAAMSLHNFNALGLHPET
jgi:hypothetical protein